MDEKTKLSIETARDASKTVLTLSTSIILVTVTFAKEFIDVTNQGREGSCRMVLGTIPYIYSIRGLDLAGLLQGEISPKNPKKGTEDTTPVVWRWGIRGTRYWSDVSIFDWLNSCGFSCRKGMK